MIASVAAEMAFRDKVLGFYRGTGLSVSEDKGAVMREIAKSGEFDRGEMGKVYSVIAAAEVVA